MRLVRGQRLRAERDLAEAGQDKLFYEVEMPLAHGVYRVLYEGKDLRDAVTDLMTREPKSEYSLYSKPEFLDWLCRG